MESRSFPPKRHFDLVRRPEGFTFLSEKQTLPKPLENNGCPRVTRLLLNVTIGRSLGILHVVLSSENTVGDLIKMALQTYVKEMRRPLLTETNPHSFELHYSQFSLESLNEEEKLINLGTRNFFLCSKHRISSVNSSCSKELANKEIKRSPFSFTNFLDFLLM